MHHLSSHQFVGEMHLRSDLVALGSSHTFMGEAKQWFLSLLAASIATWAELLQQFLDEYFLPHKTNEDRAAIHDFKQQSGEPFYESFKRFKELLRNCPHHGIQKWELIRAFYDGLLPEDVRDVNATSVGSFFENHVDIDWDILEKMAVTSKSQANASRRAKTGVTSKVVDYETQKCLDAMEIQMARLGRPSGKEVSNVVNQQQYQKRQQSYNQGEYQRNTGNQVGSDPQLAAILESLKTFEQDKEIQIKINDSFEQKLGQLGEKLSEVVGRAPGQLPSDTKLNPQHQGASSSGSKNAYVSVVSTQKPSKESELEDEDEQGEPTIPIEVGDLQVEQTLLDYGSSISILPRNLYDQSDLGPLEQADTTVVLADLIRKWARVKEKQHRVNLGRPFLATANALINCRDNTVNMSELKNMMSEEVKMIIPDQERQGHQGGQRKLLNSSVLHMKLVTHGCCRMRKKSLM
ncbi:hypothetical protein L1987_38105 [Smallanthus sonchifolius]|uniref:Uncharacterized protein n=1 Tax=Smallanthus sonchifolius TaxID=185202 RepID=A0ACB9HI97_9ASTR|nr:hypothetical protein L1987_38105 [Smallanthus sonchifolius]